MSSKTSALTEKSTKTSTDLIYVSSSGADRKMSFETLGVLKADNEVIVSDSGIGDFNCNGTDDEVEIQQAIDSLSNDRTRIEKITLIGSFVVGDEIIVPSYTEIELRGKITVASDWDNSGIFTGIFELGNPSSPSVITNVNIYGGEYYASRFDSYPTSDTNTGICPVHSVCTLKHIRIHDYYSKNVESPVTLEKCGRNENNPSYDIKIYDMSYEDVNVGIQFYSNGYDYKNISVNDVICKNCIDDVVAIVGHWGGVSGATPSVRDVTVSNVNASKNGTTGAVVKLDCGSAASGKGIMQNILVSNIVADTTGTSESLVALIDGSNGNTRHIQIKDVSCRYGGSNGFEFGLWMQGCGRQIRVSDFILHAKHSILFQGTANPSNLQTISISDGICDSRDGSTSEGNGIVFTAGTGAQGFRGVRMTNLDFYRNTYYINESATGLPSGFGTQGTYENFYYDNIDYHASVIDPLAALSSSPRHMYRLYSNGAYAGRRNWSRVTMSSDQTISNDSETALEWNVEGYDYGGMHSIASNSERFTLVDPGLYAIGCVVRFEDNGTNGRVVYIRKNGSNYVAQATPQSDTRSGVSMCIFDVGAAADYYEVRVYQDSGGDLDIQSAYSNFWICRIA